MSDPFVAEVRVFAGNFAPTGWAQCDGQLLPLSQNTALFSLLGTMYGGDGKSTFALPNVQGSAVVGVGQGSGLQEWFQGQQQGSQSETLLVSELPAHTHTMQARGAAGNNPAPATRVPATGSWVQGAQFGVVQTYATNAPNTAMGIQGLALAGGDQPHNNMMPYLTVTHIIAMQGVFPPRP